MFPFNELIVLLKNKNLSRKALNNIMDMNGAMQHEDKVVCARDSRSLSRFMAIQRSKAGKEVVNFLLLQRDNLRCR